MRILNFSSQPTCMLLEIRVNIVSFLFLLDLNIITGHSLSLAKLSVSIVPRVYLFLLEKQAAIFALLSIVTLQSV